MNNQWQPIADAPVDTRAPLIVWLPKRKMAVSALPFNVEFADDDETMEWIGEERVYGMTDCWGDGYGLELCESPTHFMQPGPPTEDK
jgi:hypothetical protein